MSWQNPSGAPAPPPPQSSPWSTPGQHPQSMFNVEDHLNSLVLVKVLSIETVPTNALGDRPAARVVIDVIDGPWESEHVPDALLFQQALLRVCRAVHESPGPSVILGRLGQGQGQAGKNAPYIFVDPTPEDVAKAEAFMRGELPWQRANGQQQPPQQQQQPWQPTPPPPPQQPPAPQQQYPSQPPQQPSPGQYPPTPPQGQPPWPPAGQPEQPPY